MMCELQKLSLEAHDKAHANLQQMVSRSHYVSGRS